MPQIEKLVSKLITKSKSTPNLFNNSCLHRINPKANLRLILIDKSLDDTEKQEKKIIKLIYPKLTHMDFNIGAALHLASKGEGILYNPDPDQKEEVITEF